MSESMTAPETRSISGEERCPACEGAQLREFFHVRGAPTNSCILLKSREEAKAYPTGEIALAHCETCGFVFNRAFDERLTEYSGRYEETQSFSGTFRQFHKELAERLIDKHDLRRGRALEIGCGKGEFLVLLAELGDMDVVGVDPGVHAERLPDHVAGRIAVHADFITPDHFDRDFDLVACKMTIEHIREPLKLMRTVRAGIGDRRDCVVFFQAPEAMRILNGPAFEDVYYEHCNYFAPGSLARLFRAAGFDILDIEIEYGGQYLTIEARPAAAPTPPRLAVENDLAEIASAVDEFAVKAERAIEEWRGRVARAAAAEETIVVWGSGSKAVAFLSAVDPEGRIQYVTDINPHRHHHFMPATGQEIIPPQMLATIDPGLVIVMNRIYVKEISRDLAAMGRRPEILAL